MKDYEGLWKANTKAWYTSKTFSKSKLPKKFNIALRYNKYHKKDKDTPNFIFAFYESDSETFHEIKEAPERNKYNIEEIFEIVEEIQELAYFGDIDGRDWYMKDNLYDIDMLARKILDMKNENI